MDDKILFPYVAVVYEGLDVFVFTLFDESVQHAGMTIQSMGHREEDIEIFAVVNDGDVKKIAAISPED